MKKIIFCMHVFVLSNTFSLFSEGITKYCPFCDQQVLNNQKFYEDDLVMALYTHKPIMKGHSLIIPKRHVERFEELNEKELAQLMKVIKKVNQAAVNVYHVSAYLLLQKNGHEAGQTVPHVHFHYIPRKSGDDSIIKFFYKMFIANVKKPIKHDKLQKEIEKLHQELKLINF
jgi:diadenosine tetraphosphate (Ap4A) HIT family hydrolase